MLDDKVSRVCKDAHRMKTAGFKDYIQDSMHNSPGLRACQPMFYIELMRWPGIFCQFSNTCQKLRCSTFWLH